MAGLTIVAVVGSDGAIGRGGDLLWHLPGDLRHFKQLTQGGVVIMGRKTWESLPKRPLPGRLNIIISRQRDYEPRPASGERVISDAAAGSEAAALTATSLAEALEKSRVYGRGRGMYIIGGGEIYRQAIEQADRLELTEVDDTDAAADTWFPEFDRKDWDCIASEIFEERGKKYRFVSYRRVGEAPQNVK